MPVSLLCALSVAAFANCHGNTLKIDGHLSQMCNAMDQRKRWREALKIKPLFLAGFALWMVIQATWVDCAQEDTLIVAYKSHINTLGLSIPTTRKAFVLSHNWADTLVYRDPQKKTLLPCLAESYQPMGKNRILFNLRKGIQFHNGEPFNAEAVKASFDYLKDVKLMPALPTDF